MLAALASGALLGLSAGLAPGPLLALVLVQTIRHGPREGCKIALSPLITDAPIILIALLLAVRLAEARLFLGLMSMVGALFVLWLAWDSFRPFQVEGCNYNEPPRSWMKGILTNLLNPHPWLFWLTVGAASLANALAQDWTVAVAFLSGFYVLLVGSKVLIALSAAQSRDLLAGRAYRIITRVLGGLLVCFAVLLFREGLRQFAISA